MNYREHKAKLLQDPEFRKAYEALGPEYQRRRKEIRRRIENQLAFARACGKSVEELVEELFDLFPEEQSSVADNLANLLGDGLTAEEWQEIIGEPYG